MATNHKTITRSVLWASSVLFVLIIGIMYFPRERPDLGFWGALYYTVRLFILEHDLGHFPRSLPLVVVYFFAPMVSISMIGTAVRYFFQLTPMLRTKWRTDHVVICGVGRTGKILAKTLKQKKIPVTGIDSDCPEHFEEWCSDCNLPIIHGDFLSHVALEKAGAAAARAIVFASGDDLLNLEGAIGAYGWLKTTNPQTNRLIWTHIADEKLADTARAAVVTKPPIGIRFFDTYYMAATKMVVKYFTPEVRQSITSITILGFGKFGRDLMEVLIRDQVFKGIRIMYVVDIHDREKEVRSLAAEFGVGDRVGFMQTDITDLDLTNSADQAFFLCTDDDIGNLATALNLTREVNGSHIYVRMAKWPMPAVEEHLSANRGIEFVNINDLVVEGLMDLPGIFEPAKLTDLKRTEES